VQVALNRNSDLMDCRERLLALYPDLDGKAFADLMGQALAVADLGAAHDRAFVMKKGDLQVTDKVKIPFPNSGVDEGWDYQPGASVAADLARLKKMEQDKLKRLGLAGGAVMEDATQKRDRLFEEARVEVVEHGRKTGNERLVLLDAKTGETLGAGNGTINNL